jgi:hypothetical protein
VPTNDSTELFQRALFIARKLHYGTFPVRALGITARNLDPAAAAVLFPAEQKRRRLNRAQDAVNERYGDWTVYPASVKFAK